MNLFESELRKLFGDGWLLESPTFIGTQCFGTLGQDLRVRAEFIASGVSNHYDALKLTVLNRSEGPVDTLVLYLETLWGMKAVPNNPNFRNGVAPHIWMDGGRAEWYAYSPTEADRDVLRRASGDYLAVFRDRVQDGPKREAPRPGKRRGKGGQER